MALERFPQTDAEDKMINWVNQMFSYIFFTEMIIKIAGLGLKEYARDTFNCFDAAIVILSMVDTILFYTIRIRSNATSGSLTLVKAFRCLRLLRAFKLARNSVSVRKLIFQIIKTLPNLTSFIFLQFGFIIVFVILGL